MAFGKRTKKADASDDAFGDSRDTYPTSPGETVLDEGSVLSGELRFGENVRLEGRVEGEVHAGKKVVVGEHAEIDATIAAETLEVFGTIVGDVRVARKTIIHKSARIEGEIHTAGIVVEEGARFRGCIVIGPDEGASDGTTIPDVPSLAAVRAEPGGSVSTAEGTDGDG